MVHHHRPVRHIALALLALLPGCTTLQAGGAGGGAEHPSVHASVALGLDALRALVADLQAPAGPRAVPTPYAGPALARVDAARAAVIAAGIGEIDAPGLSAKAELATLAILLSLCRERVRATDGLVPASEPAQDAARMLTQRCVAPLALMVG